MKRKEFCPRHLSAAFGMFTSVGRRNGLLPVRLLLRLREFSCSSATGSVSGNTGPGPHVMVDYLVNTCGFPAAEAAKASKHLAHVQSTKNADAVVQFMRSVGFDPANLRKIISVKPRFLCWSVETNLAPKFRSLQDLGLSEAEVVQIIHLNPSVLNLKLRGSVFPKLELWESLLGSRAELLKHMKKKTWFFSTSVEKKVFPNLKILKDDCGIPVERVSLVLRKHTSFILLKQDSLRALVVRAEAIGMPRKSGMFLWLLYVLHMVSEEKVEAHIKLMRTFGWSDSEFSTAIKKQPSFLGLSPDALRKKMEFLVYNVGCGPSYIAHRPKLLMFSLEKRVIPRFRVKKILESNGLWTAKHQVLHFFSVSDIIFLEKFVLPYRDKVPELLEIL